jgi:hypothetical protein
MQTSVSEIAVFIVFHFSVFGSIFFFSAPLHLGFILK